MSTSLFIVGPAASGKTTLAKEWVRARLQQGESWVLVDKDTVGRFLAPAVLAAAGHDPLDRDSPYYFANVRGLEYATVLAIAAEQLALGLNVALPGPWTTELQNGQIFNAGRLGFPLDTRLLSVCTSAAPAEIKRRVITRGDPRDAWKLSHWDEYFCSLRAQPPMPMSVFKLGEHLALSDLITAVQKLLVSG